MVNNTFDSLIQYRFPIKYNDDHIYEHIHYNSNNDAFESIYLIHIIYIVDTLVIIGYLISSCLCLFQVF